jgi:hypothetical protein
MPSERVIYLSVRGAHPGGKTGWALFFVLVSLLEIGKQRNNQAANGYQ